MPCPENAGKPENCVKNTRFLRQVSAYFGYTYPLSPENGENVDTLAKIGQKGCNWIFNMQISLDMPIKLCIVYPL